jgi:hypothetical protein
VALYNLGLYANACVHICVVAVTDPFSLASAICLLKKTVQVAPGLKSASYIVGEIRMCQHSTSALLMRFLSWEIDVRREHAR